MTTQNTSDALISIACRRWFEELSERGIFTTDADLVVRSWNPWLEAQTGISAKEAIGTPLLDLYPSLKDRELDGYYRNALEGEAHVLSERFHRHLLPIGRSLE